MLVLLNDTANTIKGNGETNKILFVVFLRWVLTKEIYNYFIEELSLGIYSYYELDFIFYCIRNLMEVNHGLAEQLCYKFAGEMVKEHEYLNSEKRKNLSMTQRLILDEISLLQGLKMAYSGLNLMILSLKEGNNLKFVDSRKKERVRCNSRFNHIDFLQFVIKLDSENFENYKKGTNNEVGKGKNSKLEAADMVFKKAEQYIKDVKKIDNSMRNEEHHNDDFLNSLLKAIIANKLVIMKLKKMTENDKITIEYELKYEGMIPVLKISDK